MKKERRASCATSAQSGLDRFLSDSFAEDPEFETLFQEQLKSLPPASARRASRKLDVGRR